MDIKPPDIFTYSNFRLYLRDAYLHRKALDKKFSHRFINQRIGCRSAGWFSDVVERRLGLLSKYIRPLSALFGLKSTEAEYLRLLVELDQGDSLKERSTALDRLMAFKGAKPEVIGTAQFEFYSEWYHSALRELLLLLSFEGDFAALAKTLDPPILPKQAKQSLLLMAKLGLIVQTPSGRWKPRNTIVVKDGTLGTVHWARIQKAFIELSLSAMDRFDKEERDFSALTLHFTPENFRMAGEEIAGLHKRLLALSQQGKGKSRVYQCNFQMFPMSRPIEVHHVSKS
jgi:uncharacterized protein (TIGR02147 family)